MTFIFEINKDSIIADIIREHPECIEVFDKHEMPCRTCMGADTGTLEEGAIMHDVDINLIMQELRNCTKQDQASPG